MGSLSSSWRNWLAKILYGRFVRGVFSAAHSKSSKIESSKRCPASWKGGISFRRPGCSGVFSQPEHFNRRIINRNYGSDWIHDQRVDLRGVSVACRSTRSWRKGIQGNFCSDWIKVLHSSIMVTSKDKLDQITYLRLTKIVILRLNLSKLLNSWTSTFEFDFSSSNLRPKFNHFLIQSFFKFIRFIFKSLL